MVFLDSVQPFLITQEPVSSASKESISRWFVEAVQTAGPEVLSDGVRPRAHDTRGVGTSWAPFHGVVLHEMMKAAFWLSPNTFVLCYNNIIMGSCIALMSVRYDPPGAPDYYPGFSKAAIRRSSISRKEFLPGTHLLHLGGVWQI